LNSCCETQEIGKHLIDYGTSPIQDKLFTSIKKYSPVILSLHNKQAYAGRLRTEQDEG